MSLPFELRPRHKYLTINHWRTRGLIHNDIDEIYNKYIYATECDWCTMDFKSSRDRCMDHCHITGEFRGFLCQKCNHYANKSTYIFWIPRDKKYVIQVQREKKFIIQKRCETKEEAEDKLEEFKNNNWWYFPWHVPN